MHSVKYDSYWTVVKQPCFKNRFFFSEKEVDRRISLLQRGNRKLHTTGN